MKLKISQLKPNPFKKQISKGELNKEQVDKIKANIEELGFFSALPIFKKGDNYHLVAGHHRLQALKEVYGKDYEVEVIVNNYNEDQVFKGMVIENITQRTNDFMELNENIVAIENYLNNHKDVLLIIRNERFEKDYDRKIKEGQTLRDSRKVYIEANLKRVEGKKSSPSDVSFWIDKSSEEVLSHDVINNNLNIFHKLDPELRKGIEKKHDKTFLERADETPNYSQAVYLSGIEGYEEQNKLKKALNKSREQRVRDQGKLVTQYKNAPEEVKEQIKKGFIDLADIDLALTQYNLRQRKNKTIKVEDISKKINGFIDRLSFSIGDTENNLKGVIKDIAVISKYTNDMNEKQKARLGMKINSFGELLSKVSKLMDEIKERV